MPESKYLHLEPIEATVAAAAAQIYAAYVTAGRVSEGTELGWMARAVDEAIAIAQMADERVLAKSEMV
jgi:hypothetical protein